MKIYIEQLSFDTIIGILPQERVNPQRVDIDIEIEYEYRDDTFIDYAKVAKSVEENMISNRYELIEEALSNLKNMLFSQYSDINVLFIKITKPNILNSCRVAVSQKWNREKRI